MSIEVLFDQYKNDFLSDSDKEKLWHKFENTVNDPQFGFFHYDGQSHLKQCQDLLKKHNDKKYFVQIGIGGSSLGPEMLINALAPNNENIFWFNNIDADYIQKIFNKIEITKTLFYVVSKSGGTAETAALMSIVAQRLEASGVKQEEWKKYFVFCTDPTRGELRSLAHELKIDALELPSNIGGRFSVQTPVGILPALFAGIDMTSFNNGLRTMREQIINQSKQSVLFEMLEYVTALYNKGINQTVLMPYSSCWREVSFWFVQLWAESLGKNGKGLTPIPAYGATDQHSQVQLFMQGPKDKLIILLDRTSSHTDFEMKSNLNTAAIEKLRPYKLDDLMNAELSGTICALKEANKPVLHLKLENNARDLGQLILLLECLTVSMGHYLEINPFDQPGVEAGKIYAYKVLSSLR